MEHMNFKVNISSEASGPTTHAPLDGAMVNQLSRFLRRLEEDIMEKFTELSKSVPIDVPPFRLSITANATGEPPTNESSISTTQPGTSSPTSPSPQDSSPSPSDQKVKVPGSRLYPTPPPGNYKVDADSPLGKQLIAQGIRSAIKSDVEKEMHRTAGDVRRSSSVKHLFEGVLTENCIHCNMPLSASQHPRMYTHAGIVFNWDAHLNSISIER